MVDLNLNENEVCYLSEDLARMPSLQTLRLQNNQLKLNGLPDGIFSESNVRKSTPPHPILFHIFPIYIYIYVICFPDIPNSGGGKPVRDGRAQEL